MQCSLPGTAETGPENRIERSTSLATANWVDLTPVSHLSDEGPCELRAPNLGTLHLTFK
jgi:hypothetical protein